MARRPRKIVLTVVVREKNFKFRVRLPPTSRIAQLKKECMRMLKKESIKKRYAKFSISIGACKEVQLKYKKNLLDDEDKTLAEYSLKTNAKIEAQVKWVEFGVKSMLHFLCQVNGKEAIGFVDTGCVLCTLSTDFVRRLGLEDEVDKRFAYDVGGPGGDRVHGCLHSVSLDLGGGATFVTNFDVMDSDKDVWLGMDLMYREGIAVDVANSALKISSTETTVDLLTLDQAEEALEPATKRQKKE